MIVATVILMRIFVRRNQLTNTPTALALALSSMIIVGFAGLLH